MILTSAPIFLTLVALIGITVYWSIHYTWQSTLLDVSERLDVAENSVELIQNKQAIHVKAFAGSYDFVDRLNRASEFDDFQAWVSAQKSNYNLDFLRFHRVEQGIDTSHYLDLTRKESFFDVLSQDELKEFGDDLAKRAQIPIYNTQRVEGRGLVSRTVVAIYNQQNDIIGFLDGGLLLNNSTTLVDQIRDLIYPSKDDALRPVGTLTVFLDDLRVSTNVLLDSDDHSGRAIGTRVSSEVNRSVLGADKEWVNRAYVYDAWYITAYQPIHDQYNNVIGMLYTAICFGHL